MEDKYRVRQENMTSCLRSLPRPPPGTIPPASWLLTRRTTCACRRTSGKWIHIVSCSYVSRFCFVRHYVCGVCPCCCVKLYIVHSYWCVVFADCMNMQLFIYSSITRDEIEYSPIWGCYKQCCMKFLHMLFGEHMDEFLLGWHCGVELLDFMDYTYV